MDYRIGVVGRTWEGLLSAYAYSTDAMPTGIEAVKRIAGDFAAVLDYRVTLHSYKWNVTKPGERIFQHTERLMHEFESEANEVFYDIMMTPRAA